MSSKLNKPAYEQLIAEDLELVKSLPVSLERRHVEDVLLASIEHHYPLPPYERQTLTARIAELEREAELSKKVVTAHRKLCDERAVKIEELEFFQFTALALETHLQALAQRLECEIGEVVTKFDEELARMDAERDKLREQLTERTSQRDEVCKDPRLQLKWGVFVGERIVVGCLLEGRAEQFAALGRCGTPAEAGELSVRRVVADWQER